MHSCDTMKLQCSIVFCNCPHGIIYGFSKYVVVGDKCKSSIALELHYRWGIAWGSGSLQNCIISCDIFPMPLGIRRAIIGREEMDIGHEEGWLNIMYNNYFYKKSIIGLIKRVHISMNSLQLKPHGRLESSIKFFRDSEIFDFISRKIRE